MEVSTIKVILIDDEPDLLEISKQFLELNRNVSVDTTSSAVLAIDLIALQEYDVIVSDYQMPGKDGIQLLKEIREMGNLTPFILFTGKGREEVAIEALNSGGDPKTQFAELSNMIRKAVQRHRMELDAIENQEKFENIFNSANDSIHILDLEGRFLEINEVGCSWLGYTKQEMLRKNVRDIDLGGYAIQVPARMKEVAEKGCAVFRTVWIAKSGQTIPVEISARRIDYEGKSAILSLARNITERKRVEAALQVTESRFDQLAEQSNTVTWEANIDGLFTYVSGVSEAVWGYRPDELVGKMHFFDMVVEAERETIKSKAFEVLKHKERFVGLEHAVQAKDGRTLWNSTSGIPLLNPDGSLRGYQGSDTDITERKRVEEAGRLNEQKLSLIMHNMTDMIWLLDMQLKFIWMSPSVSQGSGFSMEEINNIPLNQQMEPSSFQKASSAIATLLTPENLNDPKKQITFTDELEFFSKDGSTQWIDTISKVLRDERGRPTSILMVGRDITERKRAEDALQLSEARFRELFNNMDSGIAVYETIEEGNDFIFKDFNIYAEKIEGVKREDVIGRRVSEVFPGAREMGILEVFRSVWKTGRCERLPDAFYVDRNGAGTWRENLAFKTPRGEIVAVYNDITERKQVEEALRESEEKFRVISESSPDHIVVHDRDLRYVWVLNPQLGLTQSDMIGKTDYDLLPKDDADNLTSAKREVMKSGKEMRFSTSLPSPDGSKEYFEGVFIPRHDSMGRSDGIIGYFRNVTETMHAQKALGEVNRKLNLLSSITRHDINNQLMALTGNLALLKTQQSDLASDNHFLQAEAVAERISTMIKFTKEYEDIGVHPPIMLDVKKLVEKGVKGIALGSIKVLNEVPTGNEVFADPLIAKVFHNLIDNAVRHGGKITTIHFFLEEHDGVQAIVCEDDGVGVPSEMKEKIFMRGSGKSHGYGLFLSREILAITGISIIEIGESGRGAKFIMTGPIRKAVS
jgi:PAS domain S-box-containing protein